jgi:hypothetical protein
MRDNLLRTKRGIFLPTGAIFTKKSNSVSITEGLSHFLVEKKCRNILIPLGRLLIEIRYMIPVKHNGSYGAV